MCGDSMKDVLIAVLCGAVWLLATGFLLLVFIGGGRRASQVETDSAETQDS